jgi:hypothetical protein
MPALSVRNAHLVLSGRAPDNRNTPDAKAHILAVRVYVPLPKSDDRTEIQAAPGVRHYRLPCLEVSRSSLPICMT